VPALQAFVLNDLAAYGRKSTREREAFFGKLIQREVCKASFFYAVVGWIAGIVSTKKLTENRS